MLQSSPAYTIPRQNLKLKKNQGPSSNKYYANLDMIRKKFPAWKIGTSNRIQFNKDIVPGPSEYSSHQIQLQRQQRNYFSNSHINIQNSSPHYQIASKLPKITVDIIPGPATYQPIFSNISPKSPMIIFPKQLRTKYNKQQTPGPGSYKYKEQKTERSIIFEKNKRFRTQVKSNSNSNYSLNINPNKQMTLTRSPTYGFSLQKRDRKIKQLLPGPLDYNIKYDYIGKRSPKAFIGSQRRHKQINVNIPGPADYKTYTTFTHSHHHKSYPIVRPNKSVQKEDDVSDKYYRSLMIKKGYKQSKMDQKNNMERIQSKKYIKNNYETGKQSNINITN